MSWKFGFPLKNIEIILTILIKRVKQIIITNILQQTKKNYGESRRESKK